MRKIGDNSAGFQNEIEIEKALDFKLYEQLNPNLKHFLDDIYNGYDIKGKRIHAIRCRINVKPDFYLHIDGIPKEVYVSIKKGSGNSVHQESLASFIEFLNELKVPEDIIEAIKLYHYGDDTIDNTGKTRYNAREYLKLHPDLAKKVNSYFSKKKIINEAISRFVFTGNYPDAPEVDYLYHGTIHNGVWASKRELLEFLKKYSYEGSSITFGPLTYQVWNRNLKFVATNEKKRNQIQIKWTNMVNCLNEITSRREDFKQCGTFEGDMSERASVIFFNKEPQNSSFSNYISRLNINPKRVLMTRVTTKQYSKLSNQVVMTRADAYAIEVLNEKLFDVLEENNFYLDETILANYLSYFKPIFKSGISIKMDVSESYQLIKLTPNSFKSLFGNYELGYGASVFCKEKNELPKNLPMIIGWKTTIENLQNYFSWFVITSESLSKSLELCKSIKDYSIKKITEMVDSSTKIQRIVFNGLDIYDEPYSALFFMQNSVIKDLKYIPFSVTSGSGRSRGDYTIVFKPKLSNRRVQQAQN